MRKTLFAIAAAVLMPGSAWAAGKADSPYENAAKMEMEHLAANILAAGLCKGISFNGERVITKLTVATILLGRKRAEDAFFSGIRENYDEISANGKEVWCAVTIKAAKERNSEILTGIGSDIKVEP